MNESGRSQIRFWRSSLAGVLLAGAFLYVWILPLIRPRGEYLWGHYRLKDVYLGIPIGLITICFIVILAVPSRYRRFFALRLVTVVISLLVVLALCDAGYTFGVMGVLSSNYWLDRAHISRRYSAADPELGFVRKPLVSWRGYVPDVDRLVEYRTDDKGFRNAPGQQQADIVFIGDSFTESATVAEQDTFVQRVEQATALSVVNLGRGGYGPQQELIVLKRYGLAYKPRVVVWQLFEGNDLADAEAFAEWKKNAKLSQMSLKERYFNNSLLKESLTNTRLQQVVPMATLRYPDDTVRRVAIRYPYEPHEPSSRHLGITETVSAIEEGQQVCESNGIQLLVVFIPTMVHTLGSNIVFDRAADQAQYLPQQTPNIKDFSQTIQESCERAGCAFIDTVDALRQAEANGSRNLYIPNDEHLDVGAHEVVSRVVADWLRSKKLVAS